MIFNPIAPWWLILAVWTVLGGFCGWQLWAHRRSREHAVAWSRRLLLVLLLLIVALRPGVMGGTDRAGGMKNVDVYFVVDITPSMRAEDYKNNQPRIEAVKKDVRNMLPLLAGARYSVITFGNDTYIELPLTTDASAARMAVDSVQLESEIYAIGSSIDEPVSLLKAQFEKGAKQRPERKRFVYYFGDGEQTIDREPKSFGELAGLVDGGAVMGYGTEAGGKMKETGLGSDGYMKDYSGNNIYQDAVSMVDESALKRIADQMKVSYEYRGSESDVKPVVEKIDMATLTSDGREVGVHQDVYWVFMMLFVAGVLWELWSMRSDLVFMRKAKKS